MFLLNTDDISNICIAFNGDYKPLVKGHQKISSSGPTPLLLTYSCSRTELEGEIRLRVESLLSGLSFSLSLSLLERWGRRTQEETFYTILSSHSSSFSSSSTGPSGKIPSILQDIRTEIEGGVQGEENS